jgi:hypothetical protein
MKYIKIYEWNFPLFNKSNNPKIKDYVICKFEKSTLSSLTERPELKEYIESNIGQICDYDKDKHFTYTVMYFNVPNEIKHMLFNYSYMNNGKLAMGYVYYFKENQILHWSKNEEQMKDELELILNINKYNI